MIAAAEPIRQLIIDSNLGVEITSSPWPVFLGYMPDAPDNAIVVYDTAGEPDGRIMKTGERVEHPGVQIRVRGTSYPATMLRAIEIATSLDSQKRTFIAVDSQDNYVLHNVKRTSAIIPLGMEVEGDRRRYEFSVNAVITITEG